MPDGSVFISNVFPDGNKGGAAITCATLDAVKKALPDARVTAIATQVHGEDFHQTHRFSLAAHPDVKVVLPLISPGRGPLAGLVAVLRSLPLVFSRRARHSHHLASQIAAARLMLSKGGYVFVERHTLRHLMSNWLTTLPLIVAKKSGVPTAAIGATVGPFTSWHSKALNGWLLRRLDLVVVRDQYSYEAALNVGVPPDRLALLPDLVFSRPEPADSVKRDMSVKYGMGGRRVGIATIAAGSGDDTFLPALRDCLVRVVESQLVDAILLVIQSREDLVVSRHFLELFPAGSIQLVEDDLSPEELMGLYASASFVIARRLHAAIFAMIVGVPTFAVAKYAMKVQGVMRSLEMEDYLVTYPDFDPGCLFDRISTAVANREDTTQRIRTSVSYARATLEQLPDLLAAVALRARINGPHVAKT